MDNRQIFISYSSADADWARSFAEALNQRGEKVWFDQFEISLGESLRDALEKGLRASDVFVTLELGAAMVCGRKLSQSFRKTSIHRSFRWNCGCVAIWSGTLLREPLKNFRTRLPR